MHNERNSNKIIMLFIIKIHSMNKAAIVDKVHEVLGGTKAQSERAVDTVVNSIVDGLKGGDEVSIAGLGIFSAKMRPARKGRGRLHHH